MNPISLTGFAVVLLFINLGLSIYLWRLASGVRAFKKAFGQAKTNIDWEEVLRALAGKVHALEQKREQDVVSVSRIAAQLEGTIQKVGVYRFNALSDDGGNLSFTLALLNENDSGLVLTSVNGRSNTRIYAKVIDQGQGQIPLTTEETTAIIEAKKIFNSTFAKATADYPLKK